MRSNIIDIGALVEAAAQEVSRAFLVEPIPCSYELDVRPGEGAVVRTDIAQKIAGRARQPESDVAARAIELLSAVTPASTARCVTWCSTERFLNLIPAQGIHAPHVAFKSSLPLPKRIFALRPDLLDAGRRRLAARLSVQMMALKVSGAEAGLHIVSPQEIARISQQDSPLNSELSTVWIYPQSAPRSLLSETLRRLGASQRVLVESITSDEWGEVDLLPALGDLSLGQVVALAEFNLVADVDLPGAGRQEVQNLPWLMGSVIARLDTVFGAASQPRAPSLEIGVVPLFSDVMRELTLSQVALQGAARGKVSAYIGFWRHIVGRVLRIINDPTVRQRAASGVLHRDDYSCSGVLMSVLSETVAAWENHLHNERILP